MPHQKKKELTESGVTNENVSENTFRTDVDDNIPSIKVTNSEKNQQTNIEEERITFSSKRLFGSINLIGATIDDLSLKDYFETINKEKNIKILKKTSSKSPYFLRLGWASPDRSISLPDKNSKWKSSKSTYGENEKIELEWDNKKGLKFFRTIEIDDNFMISVIDKVENKSSKTIKLTNFSYLRRLNYRPENKFFILHEGPLGVFNDTLKEVSYDEIEENNEIIETTKNGWIGYTDHYWQVTIFPETKENFKARFKNIKNKNDSIQIDFINENIKTLNNGDSLKTNSYIFAGAKEVPLIDEYIQKIGINKLDLSVDFGWFYFLTKPLFYALHFLSSLVGNFGIGIIILTICIRIILFPLANKSFKSMNSMRLITPEIQRIRERYKDDRTRMNQEMFAMYKEKKINPAAGCLPILIQIPIFFALYKVLFVSIEMRHAPFSDGFKICQLRTLQVFLIYLDSYLGILQHF